METIVIGITENQEIVTLDYNGFKSYECGFYISAGFNKYDNLKTDDDGYNEAYDTLIQPDYYDDMGYDIPEFFKPFIDYEQLANYILNNEGWYDINGEYIELLCCENESYYGRFSSWYHYLDDEFNFLYIKEWELKKLRFYSRFFGINNAHMDIIKEGCEFLEGLITKYKVSDERIMKDYFS